MYRGNTSLVEYVTAGALTGALYKINLGLAATFVGAGLGTYFVCNFNKLPFYWRGGKQADRIASFFKIIMPALHKRIKTCLA